MSQDRTGTEATGPEGFSDPLEIVDRTDLSYEKRLGMLQDWQAALAREDAPQEKRDELAGAIQALEMGAVTQGDESDAIPEGSGAGDRRVG